MRAMKDSRVEWIGKIPEDYSVYRLKHLLKTGLMYGANESGVSFEESLPRYIRITDITTDGKLKNSGKLSLTEEQASDYILSDNDILFARSGATVGKAFIYKSEYGRSAFAGYLIKASVNQEKILPDFLFLYTQSALYDEWKKQIFVQATIQNIGADRYNNLPITLPPIEKQRRIVPFLKMKCAEIDRVIDATQQTIAEYKALKQSIITEAVTKGVRGPRPMKDSGVAWIGEIPAEWDMCRLKQICSINGRIGFRGYTQEDLVDEGDGAITLSPSNIVEMQCQFNKCSYISWFKYDESPEIQIGVGDILFVKTGSSYGKSGIVDHLPEKATINPQLIVARATTISSKLLLYMLQSSQLQYQVQQSVVGGTIPTIAQSKILNYSFPLPCETEQQEIIDHLDIKCQEIDQMIKTKQQLLAELENYKKSVIYEYVTGKKEVAYV